MFGNKFYTFIGAFKFFFEQNKKGICLHLIVLHQKNWGKRKNEKMYCISTFCYSIFCCLVQFKTTVEIPMQRTSLQNNKVFE